MKRILITGLNSFVGNAVEKWLLQYPEQYQVDKISLRNEDWKCGSFVSYDCVFHVAGIAHADTKRANQEIYQRVNTELTVEVAKKAKSDGVKQFVYTSSALVYGNRGSMGKENPIDRDTPTGGGGGRGLRK